ncbi:right-handed parallel beta-helix repeat-containing protein [bacterium]|nr:right-handed parallel beta-helix repeat-containing protein [bacterium]
MRHFYVILTCSLLALLVNASLFAAVHSVIQDGTGDFADIQEAIDATQDGDTIIVYTGTYYENIRFSGKNILLWSVDPEDRECVESTIIDGNQNGTVVTFAGTEDETCELSGFTITNGLAEYGGGISGGKWPGYGPYASPTITNCIITANQVTTMGAGISCCGGRIYNCDITENRGLSDDPEHLSWGGGICVGSWTGAPCSPIIENCLIASNSVSYGSGIYLDLAFSSRIVDCVVAANEGGGILVGSSGVLISGCMISGNYEHGGIVVAGYSSGLIRDCTISGNTSAYDGGGILCSHSSPTIESCLIRDNNARYGGGISCTYAPALIRDCTITGNLGQFGGGGMEFGNAESPPTIENCCITGNSTPGSGGGASFWGGPACLRNCLFVGNTAVRGGAVYCWSAAPEFYNCTIAGNVAESAGVMYCGSNAGPKISDSIIWENVPDNFGFYPSGGTVAVSYSCVEGGYEGEGNIAADPLFVAIGDDPAEGYHLATDSPCIDAGSGPVGDLHHGLLSHKTTQTCPVRDTGVIDMGFHYPVDDVTISCWTSLQYLRDSYDWEFIARVSAENRSADVRVEAYIGIICPDGLILSITEIGRPEVGVIPFFIGTFPGGHHIAPIEVLWFILPNDRPPGRYLLVAVLVEPATGALYAYCTAATLLG